MKLNENVDRFVSVTLNSLEIFMNNGRPTTAIFIIDTVRSTKISAGRSTAESMRKFQATKRTREPGPERDWDLSAVENFLNDFLTSQESKNAVPITKLRPSDPAKTRVLIKFLPVFRILSISENFEPVHILYKAKLAFFVSSLNFND